MTPEEQKVYDEFTDMFQTKGWKKYIERVDNMREQILKSAPFKIETEFQAGEMRGSINAFDATLTLQATIENMVNEEVPNQGEE